VNRRVCRAFTVLQRRPTAVAQLQRSTMAALCSLVTTLMFLCAMCRHNLCVSAGGPNVYACGQCAQGTTFKCEELQTGRSTASNAVCAAPNGQTTTADACQPPPSVMCGACTATSCVVQTGFDSASGFATFLNTDCGQCGSNTFVCDNTTQAASCNNATSVVLATAPVCQLPFPATSPTCTCAVGAAACSIASVSGNTPAFTNYACNQCAGNAQPVCRNGLLYCSSTELAGLVRC
jgi:hypothetical protein